MDNKYFDDIVKHRVEIEKLKNEISGRILKTFSELYPEIKPFFVDIDMNNKEVIINNINNLVDNKVQQVATLITDQSSEYIAYEAAFQYALIEKYGNIERMASSRINKEYAKVLFNNEFLIGEVFGQTINRLSTSLKSELSSNIRMAIINGETSKEVVERVKSKFINFSDNKLNSLTRTVIQNASNIATEETYKNNGIKYYQYCAIMDSRTTPICQSLNGKVFEVGKGPKPPQHYNCRSFTFPVDTPTGDKVDSTYKEFFSRQSAKEGLKSIDDSKFVTDKKIKLETLINKL